VKQVRSEIYPEDAEPVGADQPGPGQLNIKNERDIMTTRSTDSNRTSDFTRFSDAPGAGPGLPRCKALLWLGLPLALAAGCASNPSRSPVASNYTEIQTIAGAPVSERRTANLTAGHEIYELFMTDMRINSMSATVDEGVVTLHGTRPNGIERQSINDRILELPGVNQVKDELGGVTPTLAQSAGDQQQ
jgi:hypothetical protein